MQKPYACILIGETSLLIQCAGILQNKGLAIAGIISPDPGIISWAGSKNIPCHSGYKNLAGFISSFTCDYLLSIVNSAILSEQVLQSARIAAVNYHDAPLPKYAGVYATTWALMQGEKTHGISWHIMTAKADEGDILVQDPVAIKPDDTVHLLNTRCYEQAIRSFEKLALQLAGGQLAPQPQDLQKRSYYGLYTRPAHAGVLRFGRSTQELLNLVRALTYDPQYKNPFGAAKLLIGNTCYLVGNAQAGPAQPGRSSGEIIAIEDAAICIATADASLLITRLLDQAGAMIDLPAVCKKHNLQPGGKLPLAGDDFLAQWSERQSILARHEAFWSAALKEFFDAAPVPAAGDRGEPEKASVAFAPDLQKELADQGETFIAAAIRLLLACLHPEQLRVGFCHAGVVDPVLTPLHLVASVVPFVMGFDRNIDMAGLQLKARAVQNLIDRKTFQLDLLSRTPLLPKTTHIDYDYIINLDRSRGPELLRENPGSRIVHIHGQGLDYDGARENAGDGHLLLQRCVHFITRILKTPLTPLAELSLWLPQETAKAAADRDQARAGDHDQTVATLISRQAALHPDRIAVVQNDRQWTYQELEQEADLVAQTLRGLDAEAKTVAVCLERSPEMVAALLGILKTGAAYLPLAPDTPRQRLAVILQDAGIKVLLTSEKLVSQIGPSDCTCVTMESLSRNTMQPAALPEPDLEAPAYVIYTSGSTGKPKGVVIGHRALAGFTRDCMRRYQLSPQDRVLQFASVTFDAAVEEIYPCLCSGAALVLRSREMISSIPAFVRACGDARITMLDLPTAFWNLVISECEPLKLRLPESVRLVIIGGEAATEAMFAAWKRQYTDRPLLVNTYGPTEATVVATAFTYHPGWPHPFLPIGKPIGHVQALVMNGFGQDLPPGCSGELFLGGECLALGYLNHDELTRQAFQEHAIANRRERLYKTGDLVKRLADGNLIFIGRKDQQVKIRGFRIELDEIKSAIAAFPDVKDCAVIAWGQDADKKLAAYIVFRDIPFTLQGLRSRLAQTLPDYMLPASLIPAPEIPLTAHMKVDVKALADPARFAIHADPGVAETASELESELRRIWQQVMKISHIGLDQDFFALGGDSLTAVQLMTAIERQMGRSLPISVLFQHGAIRKLAALIESEQEEEKWRPLVTIKKGARKIPLFIIHGAGLNVLLFNTLAHHMDAEQPIYGLQARQIGENGQHSQDLAEIVQSYADEIISVHANGPYALAGFSIGGLIAYELAQYFHSRGKKVIFVGIFDTYAGEDKPAGTGFRVGCKKIMHLINKSAGTFIITLRHPVAALPIRSRCLVHKVKQLTHLEEKNLYDPDLAHLPPRIAALATALIQVVNRHTFRPYPGRIHLFRAQQRLFYVEDKKYMGWKQYVADIKIFDIPGDHSYIFAPPHDRIFAKTLQQALDDEAAIHEASLKAD